MPSILMPKEHFRPTGAAKYSLLPFRFERRADRSCLLVNEVGELLVLGASEFEEFVSHRMLPSSSVYRRLKAKHFLTDGTSSALFDQLASKYRTKKSFLEGFAKLHIFVTTLRCNQSCRYCQVSRRDHAESGFTMSPDTIRRSVDLMLATPAPAITVEFQGGESLLAFDVVREVVRYAHEKNERIGKCLDFVICTNLLALDDDHLAFCKDNKIQISTSLDGPRDLHNANRPCRAGDSYSTVTANIRRAQEALGPEAVSCLMTTTRASLAHAREIVDEYLRLNLRSMFVRELNPYGFAASATANVSYATSAFVSFYKEMLDYILEVNRGGRTFSESFATLVLTKMLTPWPVGFVDLQSPSGSGFGVVVYNYDGDVYASDESRMLAEMGQPVFRLGNVAEDSYADIFFGQTMQMLASAACNEALAGCSDCVYQPYCGADPVRNYRTQGDVYGKRPGSGLCEKNREIIRHLMKLLEAGDRDVERIFWAWIQRDDVNSLRVPDAGALCRD